MVGVPDLQCGSTPVFFCSALAFNSQLGKQAWLQNHNSLIWERLTLTIVVSPNSFQSLLQYQQCCWEIDEVIANYEKWSRFHKSPVKSNQINDYILLFWRSHFRHMFLPFFGFGANKRPVTLNLWSNCLAVPVPPGKSLLIITASYKAELQHPNRESCTAQWYIGFYYGYTSKLLFQILYVSLTLTEPDREICVEKKKHFTVEEAKCIFTFQPRDGACDVEIVTVFCKPLCTQDVYEAS